MQCTFEYTILMVCFGIIMLLQYSLVHSHVNAGLLTTVENAFGYLYATIFAGAIFWNGDHSFRIFLVNYLYSVTVLLECLVALYGSVDDFIKVFHDSSISVFVIIRVFFLWSSR